MRKQANKKNLMPLLKRVLGIMLREYKVQFGLVVALILGAALATLRGTLFMRDLVDVYIKPIIGVESPDFGPLAHALLSLALVYLIGLLCSYGYNRLMAIISQGTLKKIREPLKKAHIKRHEGKGRRSRPEFSQFLRPNAGFCPVFLRLSHKKGAKAPVMLPAVFARPSPGSRGLRRQT